MTFQYKWHTLAAYAATIGASIAYLFLPKYFGDAIEQVKIMLETRTFSDSALVPILIIILILAVLRGTFSFFQTYLAEALSQKVSYELRNRFYDQTQHYSFRFHDKHHTGNLMSRAITDVENIRMFVNMGIIRAPYFFGLFIVVSVIMLVLDWQLGLVSISFLPFIAFQSGMARLKMRQIWLRVQEMMADLNTVLQENLTGVRVVKAFASEEHETKKYSGLSYQISGEMIKAEKLRVTNMSFTLFSFQVALALVLLFGGWRVISGAMSLGELAAFIFYLQILNMPVRMTGMIVNAYARAASAGERLFEILDYESDVQDKPNAEVMTRAKGSVRFENVGFSYDQGKPVLRNITIEADPGKIVAFVGGPGSGKSSIVNLLPRFYDVDSGKITIDGRDIRDFTLESLRRNIGMVQQDVFLFSATLRENIAYGKEDASMDEVIHAAKIAQLHEHISSLEHGYDTIVGERGSTLSGGQRQRMSIARAVLLDPPVLILDDSTSSVDANTEDLIRKAMELVMQGRTTFIIANRLSTVHRADEIIVLKEGSVVERGTHQELLALGGAYRDIYELQLRPQEEVMREIELKDLAFMKGGDGS
jgi:ATP-binding cassette subfamily B protein